jgi:HPt (histidine-containing phosphotransfer) domain-containing protein
LHYPTDDLPSTPDIQVKHAYSAIFWVLTDLIVGSMGMFTQRSADNWTEITNTSEITSQIQYTSLLGSSDLDVFFSNDHFLSSNTPTLGAQRLQNVALEQNQTLAFLIPQLAFNMTISFMSSNLLSYVSNLLDVQIANHLPGTNISSDLLHQQVLPNLPP